MNGVFAVWSALSNFARALNRLAAAADAVADQVELRVELTDARPAAAPALVNVSGEHPAGPLNGEPARAGRTRK